MHVLRGFAQDLWIADGPPVRAFGIALPTRMIVVRLRNGSLWINSPVEATRAQAMQLKEIGEVAHLVSPTPLHDWRLAPWTKFFPDAQPWKAASLGDVPPAAWEAEIDQMVFRGSIVLSEIEFYHRPSRTLLVTDYIQNFPFAPGRPLLNVARRVAGILNGGSPRDLRLTFIGKRNRRLGAESVRKMLVWNFEKIVIAHGDLDIDDARSFVERSLRWLAPA